MNGGRKPLRFIDKNMKRIDRCWALQRTASYKVSKLYIFHCCPSSSTDLSFEIEKKL